jgi:hypothetical protein
MRLKKKNKKTNAIVIDKTETKKRRKKAYSLGQ